MHRRSSRLLGFHGYIWYFFSFHCYWFYGLGCDSAATFVGLDFNGFHICLQCIEHLLQPLQVLITMKFSIFSFHLVLHVGYAAQKYLFSFALSESLCPASFDSSSIFCSNCQAAATRRDSPRSLLLIYPHFRAPLLRSFVVQTSFDADVVGYSCICWFSLPSHSILKIQNLTSDSHWLESSYVPCHTHSGPRE